MTGIARQLIDQAGWCAELGSPLYAELLRKCADDFDSGGPSTAVLHGHDGDPPGSALGLRLMAALHRLVLEGSAPHLAEFYPNVGGTGPAEAAWPAARSVLAGQRDAVRTRLALPCQTNEPGRAAVLLTGLLYAAATVPRLPFRLLEIGASAGLNLLVDHYRLGPFGPTGAAFNLSRPWIGEPPAVAPVSIVQREGCDPAPVDPTSAAGRLTLTASVWADQTERMSRLRAALLVAATEPVVLARKGAAEWLRAKLAAPAIGVHTVVWHSVMWQYVSPEERTAIDQIISAAGDRASSDAPVVRLTMEPESRPDRRVVFALRSTRWPGGFTNHLADCVGHGPPVRLNPWTGI